MPLSLQLIHGDKKVTNSFALIGDNSNLDTVIIVSIYY